jgi:putative ABC transport system ATP-binding protein
VERQLTLGQLVAAEIIVTGVAMGFAKFGKHLETYYDLLAALDKLGHIEDLPLERHRGAELPRRAGPFAVRLCDVSFQHQRTGEVLRKIDLDVPAGGRVGIRGPDGSGKSTLLDLLYGLREPLQGWVEIDGVDVRALSLQALRGGVALVRGVEIFEGTIAENVRMGRAGMGPPEVGRALAQIGLLEEIRALPEGTETILRTGGAPLSLGQARRLMLARAIAARPGLLLPDEALENLHPTHIETLGALFSEEAPWTVLVVGENPAVLAHCTHIVELTRGVVQEPGGPRP